MAAPLIPGFLVASIPHPCIPPKYGPGIPVSDLAGYLAKCGILGSEPASQIRFLASLDDLTCQIWTWQDMEVNAGQDMKR